VILGIAATLGLAGCSQQTATPQAKYTVDEYLAKPDVMAAKLRECSNNPGSLQNDADCLNVKEAAKRQGVGSYDKLPPLKLSKPGITTESSSAAN
jgi:hypothetical protein